MQVRLLTDSHTHEGRKCAQGDVIELDAKAAKWLIESNRAEPVLQPARPESELLAEPAEPQLPAQPDTQETEEE